MRGPWAVGRYARKLIYVEMFSFSRYSYSKTVRLVFSEQTPEFMAVSKYFKTLVQNLK